MGESAVMVSFNPAESSHKVPISSVVYRLDEIVQAIDLSG
jgi:hypothetical protein